MPNNTISPEDELDDMLTSEPSADDIEICADDMDVTPDNVIDVVQKQRMAMLLSKSPLDKTELKLMDDMAKTSISQKRLSADEKSADSDAALAGALAQLIVDNNNPNRLADSDIDTSQDIKTPDTSDLDSQLDNFTFEEGEFGTELENVALEDVMAAPALKED